MYEYIKGIVTGLTPASVVIESGGIGYFLHISLNTFSWLNSKQEVKLYLHQTVREDAHLLYGFANQDERDFFRLLISVSGVGAATAIMMLSTYSPELLREAIQSDNVGLLKGIKGIGAKTAMRIIVELKDRVGKGFSSDKIFKTADSVIRLEALSALEMLGFNRKAAEKVVDQIINSQSDLTVEQLLKIALKSF